MIIAYPTSASGIIVLLKTPPKYRKLDYNKKITQTAVINIVFQRIFIKLDVSYASQHTFSKVTVTIFENYIYIS